MDILKPITFAMERDYSLTGPESRRALEVGLAGARWYQSPIDRELKKSLIKRYDGPAIRDTLIWITLFILSGAGGIYFWGTWWSVPFFLVYGVLYGSSTDSRWHECGHGTAFRTRWMNDVVYEFASFCMIRNSVVWRWSHARHHTDTIIVGRDPEIQGMRPPQLIIIGLNFLGLVSAPQSFAGLVRHALGRLSPDEADYVPEGERSKAYMVARIHMAIYALAVGSAIWTWSLLPLMFIGLPRLYGVWLLMTLGLTQHLGLAEDVLDHRLNSRTVLLNPVLRFLYWNMNYHIEHHMYPIVPYHALPKLHEAIKDDCPPPCPSLWHSWKEIIPCVIRQLRDPGHFIHRELPAASKG